MGTTASSSDAPTCTQQQQLTRNGSPVNYEQSIQTEQNKPERLELLRAQRLFYGRAKRYQWTFAVLAVLLPAIGVLFGEHFPEIRPLLGLASIFILLLEVGIFLPLQRKDCKRAARVQEQFDTEVLKLDWNRLVAGSQVDAEDIRDITSKPMKDAERTSLQNWYETAISKLPLPVGRLLCQRTNVAYDTRVRATYAFTLLGVAALLTMVLVVIGVYRKTGMDEFILAMALPALPLVSYLLRECRKQFDTIETLDGIRTEVERVWQRALAGATTLELTVSARALQDAIYRHRASNPLVFDWFYNRLRNKLEDRTRHGVERLVAEAQRRLNLLKEDK